MTNYKETTDYSKPTEIQYLENQYLDTDGSYYKPATVDETVKIFFVLVFAYAVVVGSIVGMAMDWIPVK